MITYVKVYLDEKIPEYMAGIIRCGSVISEDDGCKETDHQGLIDNTEYHSVKELIDAVALYLGVSPDIIEIVK